MPTTPDGRPTPTLGARLVVAVLAVAAVTLAGCANAPVSRGPTGAPVAGTRPDVSRLPVGVDPSTGRLFVAGVSAGVVQINDPGV